MRTRALAAVALPLVAGATALVPALASPASALPSPSSATTGTSEQASYLVTLAPGTGAVAPLVDRLTTRYGGSVRFTFSAVAPIVWLKPTLLPSSRKVPSAFRSIVTPAAA